MISNWFTVIWSLRTSWSSRILDVRSRLSTLEAVVSSMIIWALMSNRGHIVPLKLSLDAAMITRLTYGVLVASWRSFSQAMCSSRTTLFKACLVVSLESLVRSPSTWWRKVDLSPTSSPERVWSTRRPTTMRKERVKAQRRRRLSLLMMTSWRSTS